MLRGRGSYFCYEHSRPQPTETGAREVGDGHVTPDDVLVYFTCMSKVRTNIEIDDTYVRAIMDRYGVRTKTDAVDLALRHLAGQPMTREEAITMRGALAISGPPADAEPPGGA